MTNEAWYTAFFTGAGLVITLVGIFQIGINIAIRPCVNMLDGNYPAAMNYLNKHQATGKVLPYIISSGCELIMQTLQHIIDKLEEIKKERGNIFIRTQCQVGLLVDVNFRIEDFRNHDGTVKLDVCIIEGYKQNG